MRRAWARGLCASLAEGIALVAIACGGYGQSGGYGRGEASPAATAPPPPTATARPTRVELLNYRFSPNLLEVPAGQAIQLELVLDNLTHTFTVRGLEIDIALPPGPGTRAVQIQAPAGVSGDFPLICAIHESYDMVGTVRVR